MNNRPRMQIAPDNVEAMTPNNRNLPATLALLALSALLLGGCLKGRTFGTTLDDQNTEFRVIDTINSDPAFGTESHIKVEVHEAMVLLLGETDSVAKRDRAGELAASVSNVDRVINEILVADTAGIGARTNNSWLTARVNNALTFADSLEDMDTGRVKVVSSTGTVYLMGLVTRSQGDAVVEVARNVGGVEKVVKVFKYTD